MARRPDDTFRSEPLDSLARQLLFAPPDKRAGQVERIESLHDEIDPAAAYPLEFIVYRITRYRADGGESVLLIGESLLPDLRLLIDLLSRSVDLPIDAVPGTLTVEELARKLNVSTKTIARWRKAGLRWRWVVPRSGGRKTAAFTPEAVRRFVEGNRERVEKAAAFTQMEPDERKRLIERARRIAKGRDVSLYQVAAHLAKRTGRAVETLRQMLETYDRDHPDARIFREESVLTPRQKRIIARAHRMGVSVSKIAERFGRTRSTIYRVVNERRAAAAKRLRLGVVASPTFDRPDADQVLLGREVEAFPANRPRTVSAVPVDDLPEPLRPLYRQPQIAEEKQRSLFVRYNYLKFKAAQVRDRLDRYDPKVGDLDAFEEAIRQARHIRDLLVKANLPIVLSVAKRHLLGQPDRSTGHLLQLLELGVPVLITAVEEYNATRSQQFDSFLTNRLLQHFLAVQSGTQKALRRLTAEQLLRRMVDQAEASGVRLSLDETTYGQPLDETNDV